MINNLEQNQIIVVGTNLAGKHLGGAARQAHNDFGLVWGVGEGLYGKTYAFPTLTEDFGKRAIASLQESVRKLYQCCNDNQDKQFLLTPVGTGIAGYAVNEMKALFTNPPTNLVLPEEFK